MHVKRILIFIPFSYMTGIFQTWDTKGRDEPNILFLNPGYSPPLFLKCCGLLVLISLHLGWLYVV